MQRDAISTRSMATSNYADPLLCSRVRMVCFLQTTYSNSAGMVVGEVCSSLSPMGMHCLAPQLSVSDHCEDVSVGLRRDCFQVAVPMRPSSFRWSPWDPGGRTHAPSSCGWCLPSRSHTIKSLNLFQIKNNQISRDVKGLFLGHRFVRSRVIVKVPMLQLEDELLGKGWGNVRCQGSNGPGGPLGLGLGIRSSPCLGVK
jgi:hypothetical protein